MRKAYGTNRPMVVTQINGQVKMLSQLVAVPLRTLDRELKLGEEWPDTELYVTHHRRLIPLSGCATVRQPLTLAGKMICGSFKYRGHDFYMSIDPVSNKIYKFADLGV